MKALRLTGLRQMELTEVPNPELRNDTDVLLKMGAIGVCGSDIHYYLTGRIGSQIVKYPFTVGHECAGAVEAVGSAVKNLAVGDKVAVDPAQPCWKCEQCQVGREHTCRDLKFLGTPGQGDGCLSEYIVMPETSCFKIPDSMPLGVAAACEPLSIGVYAVKLSVPMPGKKIGILGSGPIGLSVLLPAKVQGADKIYVTDKIDGRLKVAERCGAAWTGNPDKADIVEEVAALEPLGLDVVFECCGKQEALDQAVEMLKPGGKLVLVGIPEIDRVSFAIDKLRRKEICIQNVRRQVGCVQDALDLIDSGKVNVDFMITHHFTLDQTVDAFELVAEYADGVVKAMIEL